MQHTKREMMKSIAITKRQEDSDFSFLDILIPTCPSDSVIVKNQFVGVNKGDAIRRKRGIVSSDLNPPFILGFEGLGEVVEVGRAVKGISIGDVVGYLTPSGAFAEFTVVSGKSAFVAPNEIPYERIASTICIGLTAAGLLQVANSKEDSQDLIHGGTGSVSSILLSIAKSKGKKPLVTVSRALDIQRIDWPPENIFPLDDPNARNNILEATAKNGVDTIFDCIGNDVCSLNLSTIRNSGSILYYGSASGHSSFSGIDILMKGIRIQGFLVFESIRNTTMWNEMVYNYKSWLGAEIISPKVTVISPSELKDCLVLMDNRNVSGRFAIDMRQL